jgi:hypothetical protein
VAHRAARVLLWPGGRGVGFLHARTGRVLRVICLPQCMADFHFASGKL